MGLLWNGDKVIAELKKLQVRNMRRATIHLSRKVKENLSLSGRQTGVNLADIRQSKVIREGKDERGRRSVTVSQSEFHQIADERNEARKERVRKKLEANRLINRFRHDVKLVGRKTKKIRKAAKTAGKAIKKKFKGLFKRRRGRRKKK